MKRTVDLYSSRQPPRAPFRELMGYGVSRHQELIIAAAGLVTFVIVELFTCLLGDLRDCPLA